jgi:acetyl-CoA carboxylase biotin carboxylase subunit
MGALIEAARGTCVDAIHPGYGFLAENAEFAELCSSYGFIWIGPPGSLIRKLGDKVEARLTAVRAGVPVVPGSKGSVGSLPEAISLASEVGYPVLLKAAAGGGGRGMRRVDSESDLGDAFRQAQAEALAAFGDGRLYLERLLGRVRHVEVQVIADQYGNVIHLGERDCTIQRRYQKLVEESPAPALPDWVREKIAAAAVAFARHIGYVGVGTVEFFVDRDTYDYYFVEMNTRIQVEHPVTELVTGVDIVSEQIRLAAGERLSYRQEDIEVRGHAIEVRVNAEDPFDNFRPVPGQIRKFVLPGGFGVRVDTHCYSGYAVPPYYDSLIAKLIVWGRDRREAIARMRRSLVEFVVEGIPTTIPFHLRVLEHPDFGGSLTYTRWVEEVLLGDVQEVA